MEDGDAEGIERREREGGDRGGGLPCQRYNEPKSDDSVYLRLSPMHQ